MENVTLKELNELVTIWYENYQSVTALIEGAFDPFGYVELDDPSEAEEMDLDVDVAYALFNFPKYGWDVYANQIKIAEVDGEFNYVLLNKQKEIVNSSISLSELISSDEFKVELGSPKAEEEVLMLKVIVDEALSSSQSFMDEEEFWGNEDYFFNTTEYELIETSNLFYNPDGRSLLDIYKESQPVIQFIESLRNNEELTAQNKEDILSRGTEITPRTTQEILLLISKYDVVDLDPDLPKKLEKFAKLNSIPFLESYFKYELSNYIFGKKTALDMESIHSLAAKGGEVSFTDEAINGYINFKNEEVALNVYSKLVNEWNLNNHLCNLGIFSPIDFQLAMLNFERNKIEEIPSYFRGEGGSYALKDKEGDWHIKRGELAQGEGYKSLEAYEYVKEHFNETVKRTVPIYSGEFDDENTYHTFDSILYDVNESLNGYGKELEDVSTAIKYGLVDSIIQVVDWQQPLSVLNETNLEEEIKFYIEPVFLDNNNSKLSSSLDVEKNTDHLKR